LVVDLPTVKGEEPVIFIEIICPLSAQRSLICSLSPKEKTDLKRSENRGENTSSHHFLALCSEIGILTYRAFEVRMPSREFRMKKGRNRPP
jgi:hypothetical protein